MKLNKIDNDLSEPFFFEFRAGEWLLPISEGLGNIDNLSRAYYNTVTAIFPWNGFIIIPILVRYLKS